MKAEVRKLNAPRGCGAAESPEWRLRMADERSRIESNQQALLNAAEDRLLVLVHGLTDLKFMLSAAARQQSASGSDARVDLAPIAERVEKLRADTEQTISWFHEQWSVLPTATSAEQAPAGLH